MKLLVTMNMPSASGYMVHQLTVDTECKTLKEFNELLNREEFVICRLYYRRPGYAGDTLWDDKGDIILNTAHFGKVQEYLERDQDYESFGNSDERGPSFQKTRPHIRPRRDVL
jgi:hypothetical protein